MAALDISGGTNAVTPQGSVGGGNVFNAAPLFGSLFGQSAETSGNSASTPGGSIANAPNGTAALAQPAGLPGTQSASTTNPLYLIIAATAVILLFALNKK